MDEVLMRELEWLRGRIAAINRMELSDEEGEWFDGWNSAVEGAQLVANWKPEETA